MRRVKTVRASYFGKIPSQSDFITSPGADHALVRRLDRWLADGMARIAENSGWQAAYDACGPFDVLAMSTTHSTVAAAACLPSRDHAGRRFPILGCIRLRPQGPVSFAGTAPLAFNTVWSCLQHDLVQLQHMAETSLALRTMAATPMLVVTTAGETLHTLHEYTSSETAAMLDAALVNAGHPTQVINVLAALHPLLRAVTAHPETPIGRGLILPLPHDPLRRPRMAALWMTELLRYLSNRDVEVLALMTTTPNPRLILSLGSTRGTELTAVVKPNWADDTYIDLTTAPAPSAHVLPPGIPHSPHTPLSRLIDAFHTAERDSPTCA